MMAVISSVGVRLWSSSSYYAGNCFSLPARRSSLITFLNGPRSSNSDSENPINWDEALEKLKEKKQALESASRTEIAKVERPPLDFEDKYSDIGRGRDAGPSFTKWGGSVRGGKYRLGEGADRILEFWGNGDVMLYAAMAVIILMFVLLSFRPAAPM